MSILPSRRSTGGKSFLRLTLASTCTLLLILLLTLQTQAQNSSSSSTAVSSSSSTAASSSTGTQLGPDGADPATCWATDGTCIRIGVFRCPNCAILAYNPMVDWYINRVRTTLGGMFTSYNGTKFSVFFTQVDLPQGASTSGPVIEQLIINNFLVTVNKVLQPGRQKVDFVILPPGSNWEAGMIWLEQAGIPSMSSNSPLSTLYQCGQDRTALGSQKPCTDPNTRRFIYSHGLASPGEQFFQPWVGLLKLKKATSIGVIQTTQVLYQSVQRGVVATAADYNMEIKYTKTAPFINGTTTVDQAVIDSVIDDLLVQQPDGLVLSTQNCVPWIQAFAARNYAPKSLATVLCTDSTVAIASLGRAMDYVVGSAQWAADMSGNDYLENGDTAPWSLFPHILGGKPRGDSSPHQFLQLWQQLYSAMLNQTSTTATPGYAEAAVLAPFTMLEGAIALVTGPFNTARVQEQLRVYYTPSYFGLLATNRYGENQQKQNVINQRDSNGVLQIVSPPVAATLDFIFPMPVFSDRVYTQVMLGTTIEYIVIALLCLCVAFTFSLCAYLYSKRNLQVFQAAGLPFYLMMGLGCMVAYGSVLTWGVENNSASCKARVWLWTICFHMFVDPLLASSWRISRIFSQKLQTIKLTNSVVGFVCLGLFTPQLIINIAWTAVAPLEPKIVSPIEFSVANTSYTTCSAGDSGVVFAGVTLAYSGLMLVSACYLAYKVRRAYRMFNDAKPIAMSMYIFTVTASIILVLQVSLNTEDLQAQKVLFGLRSIGILIAYQSSVSLLYFRRILGQVIGPKYAGKQDPESSGNTTSGRTPNQPVGGSNDTGNNTNKRPLEGSNGKMVFSKGDASFGNTMDGRPRGDSHGNVTKNVHMYIQPPAPVNNAEQSGTPFTPLNVLQKMPQSVRASYPGLEMSTFVDTKMQKKRPSQLSTGIIQLPAAIPLPNQQEFSAMDHGALVALVTQFHAQNQILRQHIRTQNIALGQAISNSANNTLPGTPEEPAEGTSEQQPRRKSAASAASPLGPASPTHNALNTGEGSYENQSLRTPNGQDSEQSTNIPPITRNNSVVNTSLNSPTGGSSPMIHSMGHNKQGSK